ncbi:N-acetyltransferase family protein [Deinococcus metallilatus]|uniref:N-acetyltransferase family protein n=1 Tax=Deinococcus metallilatus TaxID=1211322 RepID=A0AAJ5JZ15_9DEIO|nr:arsinothricin resistance N-acetyltransferase ArsN1 family A [Deinococcus metallilatus]MBB5294722.1 phosphinothricin acetyltransferase [Deinococcus metallilatus]QBY07749.1 N-acetyltransferase family protein [Deinococcus metallilatus]RXJ14165.1 N-acetyltransferase family protein [Deinococcus metallilatus]TLK30130.1 N-acetyltransferase family protein [Deinococcus metallilatus]GMA15939.1 N-acetyltransferase [Deinococcus metallilatus]
MTRTRAATPDDALAITRIYNQGIQDRVATFETRERSAAEVQEKLSEPYPAVVVLDTSREVVAFAWSRPYSTRPAYATIGDHGVYVAREARGQGYGEAALRALLQAARQAGLHKLTSRIFTDNTASRRLHLRCGFREVGTHRRHAQLDGDWRDVVIVEVLLDEP